jgi:hypothetical protein
LLLRKSWVWGAATVILVHVVWFALILTGAHADWVMGGIIVMFFVTMNIAGLGAFITSYTAPRHPLLLGLTMAPLTAVLATVSNLLLELTGTHVNFAGFRGNVGLLAVSLAYGIFVRGGWRPRCVAGAKAHPARATAPAVRVARGGGSQARRAAVTHLTISPFARADR